MRLEDICKVFTDGDWIESKDQSDEGIRLVQTGNIGEGKFLEKGNRAKYISEETFDSLKCTEIFPGDILVSRLPEPVGRACIIPEKEERMITAVDCTICRPDENMVLKEYLCYFMQSEAYYMRLMNNVTGTTRKRISRKNLGSVELEIPDKETQAGVVSHLDILSSIINGRKEELDKLDKLIKARFVELYNNSYLGEETTLEAITERVKVGFVGTCEKYYTDASGIPMLRTGNITDNGIDLAELKYVTLEFHEKNKKSQIHEGDLLIARHGSNGQANVYYGPEAQCLNAVVIVPNYEMTTSVFLAGLINSPVVKEQIERTLVGSTQHVVNTKSIAGLVVRIPDLIVQKEYEEFVNQVDKSKVVVQKALDETQTLFDSLMQEYFG